MRRVRELDAVRGLAALCIVVYHFRASWLPFGWGAVDLFFVLSGFLITSIIQKHGGSDGFLAAFYVRRGLRIWPIYYLSVFILVLLGPWLIRPNNLAGLPYSLVYLQNLPHYWGGPSGDFTWYLKHTWTLAIEEQFYLIWPPLVILAGKRRLPALAGMAICVSLAARASGLHWWLLLSRCDGFAIGALLAWAFQDADRMRRHRRSVGRVLVSVGLTSLVYLVIEHLAGGLPDHGPPPRPALTILALNLLSGAVVGLVASHAGQPALKILRGPILGYIGKISYGLYLYHMILFRMKMDYVEAHGLVGSRVLDWAVLAASFLLAAISWHALERPILAWKDRFAYRGEPWRTPSRRVDAPHASPGEPHAAPAGQRLPSLSA